MRIPITDKPQNSRNGSNDVNTQQRPYDGLGSVAEEVAGPGGADVSGGDITAPQDAGEANEENNDMRIGEEDMWEQQEAGEVGEQTRHLKPSPGNPEEGLPENPTGSENTGGANPQEDTPAEQAAPTERSTPAASAARNYGNFTRNDEYDSVEESTPDPLTEAKEQLLRLTADFENYKRQAMRRETEARERAVRGVLMDLLPVLDNFERAVDAAKNAKDVESLRIGVEYILKQLQDTLQSLGIETIQAKGQKFDLTRHEATEEVATEAHAPGTVIDESQRGYVFKGQVIRPSRVRVAS